MPIPRHGVFLLLMLTVLAFPCRADVGPPVTVTILDDSRPAEAGELFEGVFRILAHEGMDLTDMHLVEDGNWMPQYVLSPSPGTALGAGDFVDVPFGVQVQDPDASPLALVVEFNGVPFQYGFGLSPRAFLEGETEQPLLRTDREPMETGREETQAAGPRSIRVHGRCVYTMPSLVDVPVDGMSVQIFDTNNGSILGDALLASGTTDSNGYFDFTFFWPGVFDADPDIVVRWRSENSHVSVRNSANKILNWYTPTWNNFAGTDLDVGSMKPAVLGQQVYLHMLTVLTRAWRWVQTDLGLSVDFVKARRDDSGGPWYEAGQDMIHMNGDPDWNKGRIWDEVTLVHEYGHHLVVHHGAGQGSGYCNSAPCETCQGCPCANNGPWGEEQPVDAWNEGFPTWMGLVITERQQTIHSVPVVTGFTMESLQTGSSCNGPQYWGDPTKTEGFFVCFLNDLTDAANEDDPATPGFSDALTWSSSKIWDVMWLDQPLTPMDFLNALVSRNFSDREAIWETARNNSYELDLQKPGTITSLVSPSHTVGVPSVDGTVDLAWVTAYDDMSGIAGYSLRIDTSGPQLPDATQDIGDVFQYTSAQLLPGSYWVNLRAVDRSGKWSNGYATIGPFVIATPLTANISDQPPQNWVFALVPQPVGSSSSSSMPLPPALFGDAPTWWNLGVTNNGTSTSGAFTNVLIVDGVVMGTVASDALRAGSTFTAVNQGPVTIAGGRHAFECWLDAQEVLGEPDETDNFWAKQWIWEPTPLTMGEELVRPAPPDRTAGWRSISGDPLSFNLDGHRVIVARGFHALTLRSLAGDDYDLELHEPATGPLRGFDAPLGWSTRLAGDLDAVLLHNDLADARAYDAGVTNYSGGGGDYAIGQVEGQPLAFSEPALLAFDPGEMLKLYTVEIAEGQIGHVSVRVQVDPAQGPIWTSWRDAAFTVGGLFDGAVTATDAFGESRLDLFLESAGIHVLTLWRDPASGTGARTVALAVEPTAPDIAGHAAAGWYAALVPLPVAEGTPTDVPAPDLLVGDLTATFFNLAVIDPSPSPMPGSETALHLDSTLLGTVNWPAIPGGSWASVNSVLPTMIRGGRHALWAAHDAPGATDELDETNNALGEQWIWQPPVLAPPNPIVRGYPPNPVGGWSMLSGSDVLWFNADGMRLSVVPDARSRSGMWSGVAILPGPASDFDLQLHEASAGPKLGFDVGLALSGWGTGASDFVVANFNRTSIREFDAGVHAVEGAEDYRMQAVTSIFLGTSPSGVRGPFTLEPERIVQLHELWLDPGNYVFHLINSDGRLDLGMTLHPGNAAFVAKSTRVPGAIAWMAPAGEDEWFSASIDLPRYYCLSVWRSDGAALEEGGRYSIDIQTGITSTEPTTPVSRTALLGVVPNPFNPRTTIRYFLGEGGHVALSIYNVAGRRVRDLVDASLPAGEHRIDWSGEDDSGDDVASGAYFLRFDAEGTSEVRKILLLK